MSIDVFISYSTKDKVTADATCALLEANGIRCWIAPRDILPGMEWGEAIVEALESCKVMVLVFSSNANESRQIRREVERAESRGVPVVPLRIENVVPTKSLAYYMGSVHWLDALTPPLEQHIQRLAEVVTALKLLNRAGGQEATKSEAAAVQMLAELSDAPPVVPSPPPAPVEVAGPAPVVAPSPVTPTAPAASQAPATPDPIAAPPPIVVREPERVAAAPPPAAAPPIAVATPPVPFLKTRGVQLVALIGLGILVIGGFKLFFDRNADVPTPVADVSPAPTVTPEPTPAPEPDPPITTGVMTWKIMSSYKYKIQVAFYSAAGDREWPGNGDAYNVDDSLDHDFPLTCNLEEKICMGAWATGNATKYWGVGYQNKKGCKACCFICGSGEIPRQVIN